MTDIMSKDGWIGLETVGEERTIRVRLKNCTYTFGPYF